MLYLSDVADLGPNFYVPFGATAAKDVRGNVTPTTTGSPSSTTAGAPSGDGLYASGFGSAAYHNYGALFPLTSVTEYTVAMWLKASTSFSPDWNAAFGRGETGWQIRMNGTGSSLTWTGHGADDSVGPSSIKDDVWRHWTFVYKSSTKFVYVNGILTNTIARASANGSGAGNLWIGNNPSNTSRPWNGGIKDVLLWSTLGLSAKQVLEVASKPRSSSVALGGGYA